MISIKPLSNLIKNSLSFGRKIEGLIRTPKIGLALGGGSAWGIAHIGVLKAIEEYKIPIGCISGTSVGALIGGLYALGVSVSDLIDLAHKTHWRDLCRIAIPTDGLLSNQPIESFIHKQFGIKTFDDLKIPFSAVCTDLITGEEVSIQSGKLAKAIRASTAVPGIFQPVVLDGRTLVDGGVINNIPVSSLGKMGANRTLAVNLSPDFNRWIPKNSPEIILKSFLITQHKISLHEASKANILININMEGFSPIDLSQPEKLIQKGYEQAFQIIKKLRKRRI